METLAAYPIFAVLVMLGALVLFHELGHYLAGKALGVAPEVFSIGFGPRIVSFTWQGTQFCISIIPLGGYVKFAGASRSEKVPPEYKGQELWKASPAKRAMIYFAGPLANFILAWSVFSSMAFYGVEQAPSIIGMVRSDSPAELSGLEMGDRVVSIAGDSVSTWAGLQQSISARPNQQTEMRVMRGGEVLKISILPDSVKSADPFGRAKEAGRIGVGFGFVPAVVSVGPPLLDGLTPVGFETGDRIVGFSFAQKDNFQNIRYWPEFLEALGRASKEIAMGALEGVAIKVQKNTENVDAKVIFISHRSIGAVLTQLGFEPATTSLQRLGGSVAKHLGILDSQLALQKVRSPLEKTLEVGDRIVAIEGTELKDIFHFQKILSENTKSQIEGTIMRSGTLQDVQMNLEPFEVQKPEGKSTAYRFNGEFLGASQFPDPYIEDFSFFGAVSHGFERMSTQSAAIVSGVWGLVTGSVPMKALGGPMLIAKVAGDSAKLGFQAFLTALALISLNLGIINLFPIPVLDGGQLVLVGLEVIKRKPLSEAAMENFQRVGFVMVLGLVILTTYNDLSRFWASFVKSIIGSP